MMTMATSLSFVPIASGLRINEVELNPPLDDSGNEWVELYSESEINLEGYYFYIDEKKYNLTGIFSGYFSHAFPGQWLDNKNETIVLMKDNDVVDRIDYLNDDKNNGLAWSFCGEWKFIVSTRGEDNNCDGSNNVGQNLSQNTSTANQNSSTMQTNYDNDTLGVSVGENPNPLIKTDYSVVQKKKEKIVLNKPISKSDESVFISREYRTQLVVVYSFAGFCVLLIILLALRKL